MNRRPRAERGRFGTGLPYEQLGPYIGPGLAVVGLVVVAFLSIGLINGRLPLGGNEPGDGGPGGPIRTPTPSGIVVVDPRTKVPGSIVYAKTGNIWIQSGDRAYRLTYNGQDAMPSWSPDGKWIYFVRFVPQDGRMVVVGVVRAYGLEVPTVMRIQPGGDTPPEPILTGLYEKGSTTWSYFIREPVLSPDGSRLALVSDGPNPVNSDVVLQFYDLATKTMTSAGAAQNRPLGHQDPTWTPDGAQLLYVKNGRDGSRGAPTLMRYVLASGESVVFAGPGYNAPAFSHDGRFIVATRTDGLGTDIVILDAATGVELLRVTRDGRSFGGTWSPLGDAIAFQHIDRGVVDLHLVKLNGTGPNWTVGETLPMTVAAGLDADSRPGWFIPADQLPAPTPVLTPVPTPGPSAAPPASAGP